MPSKRCITFTQICVQIYAFCVNRGLEILIPLSSSSSALPRRNAQDRPISYAVLAPVLLCGWEAASSHGRQAHWGRSWPPPKSSILVEIVSFVPLNPPCEPPTSSLSAGYAVRRPEGMWNWISRSALERLSPSNSARARVQASGQLSEKPVIRQLVADPPTPSEVTHITNPTLECGILGLWWNERFRSPPCPILTSSGANTPVGLLPGS